MKDLQMDKSGESISETQYNQFINEFSLKLPKLYKQIMLKNNGGYPTLDSYGTPSEDGIRISSWNRISLTDENILDSISEEPKVYSSRTAIQDYQINENIIPKNLYPFALNEGGNDICIDMEDNFKIYIYYSDAIDNNLRFISSSFDDFFDALEDVDR